MDKYLVGFLIAAALGLAMDRAQRVWMRGWGRWALLLAVQAGLSILLLIALGRVGARPMGGDALAAAASTALLLGFMALVLAANGVIGPLRLRGRARAGGG